MKRSEISPISVCFIVGFRNRLHARSASKLLREEVLREFTGVGGPDLQFSRTNLGKPFLVERPDLHWSSSSCEHATGFAICTGGPVGLDVESQRPELVDDRLLRSCLTAGEYERWREPIRLDPTLFFGLWVRKEAALKCVGLGLHQPPNRIEVGEPSEEWVLGSCDRTDAFHVRSLDDIYGSVAAIASDTPRPVTMSVHRIEEDGLTLIGRASVR